MKRILLLLVLLVWLAPEAAATTVRSFSLRQLFREADRVVVGEVTGKRSFWNDAHDTIYTEYTVAVERTEKGTQVDTVTVRLMGGTVGETSLTIAGNAVLAKGERVLLVLRDQGGYHTLVGMSQGKWHVRRANGIDAVHRGPASATEGLVQPEGKPLSDLLQQFRTIPASAPAPEVKP